LNDNDEKLTIVNHDGNDDDALDSSCTDIGIIPGVTESIGMSMNIITF